MLVMKSADLVYRFHTNNLVCERYGLSTVAIQRIGPIVCNGTHRSL